MDLRRILTAATAAGLLALDNAGMDPIPAPSGGC